jgi:hypothetical protein
MEGDTEAAALDRRGLRGLVPTTVRCVRSSAICWSDTDICCASQRLKRVGLEGALSWLLLVVCL